MLGLRTAVGAAVTVCISGAAVMGASSWRGAPQAPPERLPAVTVAPSPQALAAKRAEQKRAAELEAAVEYYEVQPQLAESVLRAAREEGVEPRLALALVHVESRFDPQAVGPAGAVGLAQVMSSTARGMDPEVERQDLVDPETNARLGMRYLRGLIDRYGGDRRLALTAYNRGPATVARARRSGQRPYNGYAERVLANRVPCDAVPGWCGRRSAP